jgi:hypothetical protein
VSAAEALATGISEPLSWAQICKLHPDQWVCLVEIEHAAIGALEIQRARVVGHGTTKREPIEQAKSWWSVYSTIGHFYTGTLKAPDPRRRTSISR